MVKLKDASIDQMVTGWQSREPEVQAIGYAIMLANRKTIEQIEKSMVYAGIDALPEKILDVLAIEMRAQYYEQELDIEQKRRIIKNTLYLYSKAGTKDAVSQMIEQVFGGGVMQEWFEYGGEPYHFKVDTMAVLSQDINDKFTKLIKNVKNIRSHLDQIIIKRTIKQDVEVTSVQQYYTIAPVVSDRKINYTKVKKQIIG